MNLPNTLVNNTPADADEVMANFNLLLLLLNGLPDGTMLNGKISPAVSSNNLTVSVLTNAGTTPSATNPVYVKINGTWYTINSALTVTKNAGTNWGNAGGSELATKEIDWFGYIILRTDAGKPTTNSNLDIGISRICHGTVYSDFSGTTTNEKHLALGTAGTPTATDNVVLVGRFAATLSATAAFNWSVPTYTNTNLIQRPIYETRWLSWTPTRSVSAGTAPTYTSQDINKYKITGNKMDFLTTWDNAAGGTAGAGAARLTWTLPFGNADYVDARSVFGSGQSWESGGTIGSIMLTNDGANNVVQMWFTGVVNVLGNDQSSVVRFISTNGRFQI